MRNVLTFSALALSAALTVASAQTTLTPQLTVKVTVQPEVKVTVQPTVQLTVQPTMKVTVQPAVQPTVPAPVVTTEPSLHLPSGLSELLRDGTVITLMDAQGRAVASVNADGTVKLADGMVLSSATVVSVTQGSVTTSYALAVKVNSSGQLFVTTTNAEGRTQVIPLVAAVNRAADAKADGRKDDKKEDGKKDDKKEDGKKDGKKDDVKKSGDHQDQDDQDEKDGAKGDAPAGEHGDSGKHGNSDHR